MMSTVRAAVWKIYYGDRTTFSSGEGRVQDAPAYNVQVLAYPEPLVGKVLLKGPDFYVHQADRWFGTDEFGMVDQLIEMGLMRKFGSPTRLSLLLKGRWTETEKPGFYFDLLSLGPVKAGRWIPREKFQEIYRYAMEDKELPRKSAWMPLNRCDQSDAEKEAVDNPLAPYAERVG